MPYVGVDGTLQCAAPRAPSMLGVEARGLEPFGTPSRPRPPALRDFSSSRPPAQGLRLPPAPAGRPHVWAALWPPSLWVSAWIFLLCFFSSPCSCHPGEDSPDVLCLSVPPAGCSPSSALALFFAVFPPLDLNSNTVTVSHPEPKAGSVLCSCEPALTRSRHSLSKQSGEERNQSELPLLSLSFLVFLSFVAILRKCESAPHKPSTAAHGCMLPEGCIVPEGCLWFRSLSPIHFFLTLLPKMTTISKKSS